MLQEELDIYDDLDQFQEAETKKCKELEAWEAKYDAAKLEIESLQAEKKALAKKIRTMEVNFQNLLDTAKAEIKRKDAQITQLRKEKDDICFRRKQPPKLGLPKSQITSSTELQQHQQSKRFKRNEMADRKTENEIAFNKKNDNCDEKAKTNDNPEAKRSQAVPPIGRDGKEREKFERQDKRDRPLCSNPTAKVPAMQMSNTHDRDHEKQRERHRDRDRDRDRARGRSRRRSRSRSRSRSREHSKSRSQRHNSRSKDQRRKRSRSRSQYRSRSHSRSRSTNQTNSKNSKSNSCRETERGPNAKCTAQSKSNKHETMDALFGSTPTQKSPSNDGNRSVDSLKVIENLLANASPSTPIELYTPQSQIEAKEEQQTHELIGKEKQLLVEDINNYFESNVERIKQVVKQVPRQHILVNEADSKLMESSAESKMNTEELVNDTDKQPNKNARKYAEKEAKIKTPRQKESIAGIKVVKEKPNSVKILDDILVNDTAIHQRIPGLDFIGREQERESDTKNAMDNEHIPCLDLITGEQKRVFDTDNAMDNEHIPDMDLINGKEKLNEMDKARASKLIGLDLKKDEMMEVIEGNEHKHASSLGSGDQANSTNVNDAQGLNSEEVVVEYVDTKSDDRLTVLGISVENGSSIAEATNDQEFNADLDSPKGESVKKKKKKRGKTKLDNGLQRTIAEEVDTISRAKPIANIVSQIKHDLNGEEGVLKHVDTEMRKATSDNDASGETDLSKEEEMPDLVLGVEELTSEATDSKMTPKSGDNQKTENRIIAKLDVESNEAVKQDCVTAAQLKSNTNESLVTFKTEVVKTNTTNCDNTLEQAKAICHPESRQNMETTVNESTTSPEQNPCQLAYALLAEENLKTPKRPARSMDSIQIIEDIRLPIKMDIENIAVKVDGSNKEQNHTEDPSSNMGEAAPAAFESENSQLEFIADNQNDSKSGTIVTLNRTITPKLTVGMASVMYAQPDSTKIDHIEDDATLEAAMNELIPVKPLESYPNLCLETDTIEMALKQLHQTSRQGEDPPDEAAVTSTSMKGGQTPKQDIIQILMQSPMQETAEHSPLKQKNGKKQIGERKIRKRKSPSSENVDSLTPDQLAQTPLKKRTKDEDNEHKINNADPSIPPTPPEVATTAEPSQLSVTIDETCYASSLDQSQSLNSSDSLLVTKRCSLGNSDYQFERLNDEVVLRVTRRRRRRPPAVTAIINDT
ncbi:PREDICTED: uncharacterized protein LOC108617184 [Drosophila arizonae]|uniref:Uncharacterized protein LOC108617184 n=1 Tax=Drosophila arizonae TaxID=7263 RepID=A0ABM1PMF0_DROAR|nr:PREDICTED: uncharacterized protein LOC108617184 [Drosophila arizonae]